MDTDEAYARRAWVAPAAEIDARSLRRLNRLLESISRVGEILVMLLLPCVLISALWLVLNTNFENVIFYDGTDSICIFDGLSGEIRNVD